MRYNIMESLQTLLKKRNELHRKLQTETSQQRRYDIMEDIYLYNELVDDYEENCAMRFYLIMQKLSEQFPISMGVKYSVDDFSSIPGEYVQRWYIEWYEDWKRKNNKKFKILKITINAVETDYDEIVESWRGIETKAMKSAKAFIIAKALEQHEIEKQDYDIEEILNS